MNSLFEFHPSWVSYAYFAVALALALTVCLAPRLGRVQLLLFVVLGLWVYVATVDVAGRPRSVQLTYFDRGEQELHSYNVIQGDVIELLLRDPITGYTRLYSIPWTRGMEEAIIGQESAARKAGTGTMVRVVPRTDRSADSHILEMHPSPQPAYPPKQ